ncbi:hypothetical protein OSB04_029659 [Centaurea solstitialis]|uniref:Uncharacterized protein n=1 Tax=Centaurea solstitialis TaxID=347529 RepID=A0AA38SJ41_9ASTR|nr:hypothetical protein OSB04_029659 [Centaurea solstitialis]
MGVLKCVALLVMIASTSQLAQAQGLQSLISVSGLVSCSPTGNIVANAPTPTPPFPNALVDVSVVEMFNIILNPVQILLNNLLSPDCNVRVVTPLSNCNEALPTTGFLQATLQLIDTTTQAIFNIFNMVPSMFQLTGIGKDKIADCCIMSSTLGQEYQEYNLG